MDGHSSATEENSSSVDSGIHSVHSAQSNHTASTQSPLATREVATGPSETGSQSPAKNNNNATNSQPQDVGSNQTDESMSSYSSPGENVDGIDHQFSDSEDLTIRGSSENCNTQSSGDEESTIEESSDKEAGQERSSSNNGNTQTSGYAMISESSDNVVNQCQFSASQDEIVSVCLPTSGNEDVQKILKDLFKVNEELVKKNKVHVKREKEMEVRIEELEKENEDLDKLNQALSRHGLEVCDEKDAILSEVRSLRYQCEMNALKLEESEKERKDLKECLGQRTSESVQLNSNLNATMLKLEEAVDLAEQFRTSAQRNEEDLRKHFRSRELEMTNDFYNQRMEIERESRANRIGLRVEVEAAKREKNEIENKMEILRSKVIECGCELKKSNIECFNKAKEIEYLKKDFTKRLENQAQEHEKALHDQAREKEFQSQVNLREELRKRRLKTRLRRFFLRRDNDEVANNSSLTFPMFSPLSS